MLQRPEGTLPAAWFSKPSQNTVALVQPPPELPLGLADGLADGLVEGLLDGLVLGLALGLGLALRLALALALGDDEEPPAQDTPLSAKSVGVALAPEKVPWKPKFAVPPV